MGRSAFESFFTLKRIFQGLICLNLIAVIILYISTRPQQQNVNNKDQILLNNLQMVSSPMSGSVPTASSEYEFDEPLLAYPLLKYLDEFEPVHPRYYDHLPQAGNWSHLVYMGLHIDENYCDKHRAYFVSNPKFIFEQANALFDYWPRNTLRLRITVGILDDLQPNISTNLPDKTKRLSWIDPRQQYFLICDYLHAYLHIGKNFACLTQAYNHVPGDGHLNRKDFVSESITRYGKKYLDRPECFSYEKRFPRTWVMYLEDQCKDFFANLMSEKHAELKAANGVAYIRKIGAGAHNAKGVFVMDDEEEEKAKVLYENGNKCGKVRDNNIIQSFIPKPLLLFNRKFHFRIYMFIASVNPLMAYYHDGYVKLSLNEYDPNSNDKFSLISNVLLGDNPNGTYHGMNKTELLYFSRFELDVFQRHLLEQGIVKDPNFVDNYIRPEFKKTMIHLLRMTQDKFLKRSQIYELFGVDFIMDEDLNIWFIECNTSPSLEPTYPETEIFIKKLIKDKYEIIMGLTRSRAKRVIKFINELTKRRGFKMDHEGKAYGLDEYKDDFKKIIQNQFEPEFLPSPDNGYEMIIDEHFDGPQRYFGLLNDECLDQPKDLSQDLSLGL